MDLSPAPVIVLVQKPVRLSHLHLQVIQIQAIRLMKIKHLRLSLIRGMVQVQVLIQSEIFQFNLTRMVKICDLVRLLRVQKPTKIH